MIDEFDQNVHFVEIDIEEDPEVAEAANIMGTPCVQFFKNKEMIRFFIFFLFFTFTFSEILFSLDIYYEWIRRSVSGVKMKKEYREFIEANK